MELNISRIFWIYEIYSPPRWMRREAYYKAKHLHRVIKRKHLSKIVFSGEIGKSENLIIVSEKIK